MDGFGNFGFGNSANSAKLSKMLIQAKQISSDVTNIIPVSKDPQIVTPNAVRLTALYEQLRKVEPPESTYTWNKETSDNFGKFVAEGDAATKFSAQKGTYASPGSVATRLMSYVMNIGMIAQKNTRNVVDLVRNEQQIANLAMRKGIERCLITGAPAAAADGGVTDALAFSGLETLITTNVTDKLGAAVDLDDLDTAIDNAIAYHAAESNMIAITDTRTLTHLASLFYNTFNTPMGYQEVNAGLKLRSYRNIPFFVSDYMPTASGSRGIHFVDTDSTVIPEFWPISQVDLGRTQLSDDSIMFWMGALAVKDETKNSWIKNIL